jgi:DNA-binding transcriptional ArsR family regulator
MGPRYAVYPQSRINSASVPLATHPAMEYIYNNDVPDDISKARRAMSDQFSEYYAKYLDGSYDCIDRIVLNAYFPLIQSGGGFRVWWRSLTGSDDTLDTTHLMRFAGHFSRRIQAFAKKNNIPLVFCESKTRKHESAEELIPKDVTFTGLFCIMVGRAPAAIMEVKKFPNGTIDIRKKKPFPYVNHYYFHIIDKHWGHITIRFCPHPPFNAMIMLNGHEFVERQARNERIPFTKEDNCFTAVPNATALNRIADTMISINRDVGRLLDVCERWIYSTCLCFALELTEQEKTGFKYSYSVFQVEYSRNLLFTRGTVLDKVFNGVIDRTRSKLDMRRLKTIFGSQRRPHAHKIRHRFEVIVEKPAYDLTVFKVHFDRLTLKIYSKGERVLRIESITHNAGCLKCGKQLSKFHEIVAMLSEILQRFMSCLWCVDVSFIDASALQSWHEPSIQGKSRVAGININNQRLRAVMDALVALAIHPLGITTKILAEKVREMTGMTDYSIRQAAYDLKKFRGKGIVTIIAARRYETTLQGLRTMAAYLTLTDHVIVPLLNRSGKLKPGKKPANQSEKEQIYDKIQNDMRMLFKELKLAA